MENESVAAKRRVNVISSHFIPYDASTTPTNLLFPMNCSTSLNTVVQRRDNKTYFARQGSSSQGCFMRPVSMEQDGSAQDSLQKPLFSRPTNFVPKIPKVVDAAAVGDSKLSATEPQFSRANGRINEEKNFSSMTNIHALSSGSYWTPKLDVAESGPNFVLTVELPGVDVNDIRVEVNDKALTIKGNRRCQCEKVKTGPTYNTIKYHKREILQGPYQAVWQFPPNVDKNSVSAAFVDGFLRITIPRL